MKVFSYLEDIFEFNIGDTCVALGNFDGVHLGHQALIKECVRIAKKKNLTPVVFTFLNHPANVIFGENSVKNIQTIEDKTKEIEDLGIEYMVTAYFDERMMNCEPEHFVKKYLVKLLNMKEAVCGFNYSFGKLGKGSPETLSRIGKELGFGVNIVSEFKIDDVTVSSTFIRKLISTGEIDKYEKYKGSKYKISGRVVKGQMLGRTIGFPTINLNLDSSMTLPLNGVYITKTYVNGKVFNSITNVGNKPTVGIFTKNAETHIFDFDDDIYDQLVSVEFVKMLRPEMKFESIEALSAQIASDCLKVKEFFSLQ